MFYNSRMCYKKPHTLKDVNLEYVLLIALKIHVSVGVVC